MNIQAEGKINAIKPKDKIFHLMLDNGYVLKCQLPKQPLRKGSRVEIQGTNVMGVIELDKIKEL